MTYDNNNPNIALNVANISGLMNNAEQATITNLQFNGNNTITATVQNTGDVSITITSAFVNGNTATVTSTTIAKATTQAVNVIMPSGTYLADGTQYQVKLITTKGNAIVYTVTDLGVTVTPPSGLIGNAEQVSVSNAVFTANNVVRLTVRNTGGATVTINSATIDGNSTALTSLASPASMNVAKGGSGDFSLTLASGSATFVPGAQYEIRLVTAKGTTIVYTATYNPIT